MLFFFHLSLATMLDRNALLRMPSDGRSELGSSCGQLCVRYHTRFIAGLFSLLFINITRFSPISSSSHFESFFAPIFIPHASLSVCRLPPSTEGEWWELVDESRGIPYYYHTKTNETVWEKPDGFVIPLGILQVCRLNLLIVFSCSLNLGSWFSGDSPHNPTRSSL